MKILRKASIWTKRAIPVGPLRMLLLISLLTMQGLQAQHGIFILKNQLKHRIDDAPILLKRKDIGNSQNNWLPFVVDSAGTPIPCQVDDIDQDGKWDELSFVYSLAPLESVLLSIEWAPGEKYPVFEPRTNIRYGKVVQEGKVVGLTADFRTRTDRIKGPYPYQMDGIAWENDKIGFRHYFDGRNDRDIFGKKTSRMVLDSVGLDAEEFPANTYQTPAPWGRDILDVGRSFGLGGLAAWSTDTLIQLGNVINGAKDNVDSTFFQIITEGPVKSVFKITHRGWQVLDHKVNLIQTVTIWAGQQSYENSVTVSGLPQGFHLITGISTNRNTQPLEKFSDFQFEVMMTHDRQTTPPASYLGMAVLIPKRSLLKTIEMSANAPGLSSAWCAALKTRNETKLDFDVYAAWEKADIRFEDRSYFKQFMTRAIAEKNNPVRILGTDRRLH